VHNSFVESGLEQTNLRKSCKPILLRRDHCYEGGMAEECFKWAREAHSAEVRVSLLKLAQVWLDLAAKLDGLPPTRTQSAPDAA
jgi:hypothetical protein